MEFKYINKCVTFLIVLIEDNKEKGFAHARFSWARRNIAKPTSNLHKISIFIIILFAYFEKRSQMNVYLDRINIRKRG